MATFKETSSLYQKGKTEELNPKEASKLKVTNKVSNVLSAARMFETMATPSIKDKLAKFENKGPKNNEISSNIERKNNIKGFETNINKKNNISPSNFEKKSNNSPSILNKDNKNNIAIDKKSTSSSSSSITEKKSPTTINISNTNNTMTTNTMTTNTDKISPNPIITDNKDLVKKDSAIDLMKNSTSEQSPPTNAAAAIAMLASRISALEDELETVGKEMVDNVKREIDLDLELDTKLNKKEEEIQTVTEPIQDRLIQLDADLAQYNKYRVSDDNNDYSNKRTSSDTKSLREHSDYFSDPTTYTTYNSSSDIYSSKSLSRSSPTDFSKSENGKYSGEGNGSFQDDNSSVSSIASSTFSRSRVPSYETNRSIYSAEMDSSESLKAQLEKKYNEDLEKARQELTDELEKTKNKHWSELERTRKELSEQNKWNEEKIRMELTNLHKSEKEELMRIYDAEKDKIGTEIETLTRIKERTEKELIELKERFESEKQSIIREYEREKGLLREEHEKQLNNISRLQNDAQSTINEIDEIRKQNDIEKMELESRLERAHQSERELLLAEIKQKEESEANWRQYKKDTEATLNELKTQLSLLGSLAQQKEETESKLSKLDEEHSRTLEELQTLIRKREDAENTLVQFQQEKEKIIQDLKNELYNKENAVSASKELRDQLNDANDELSKLRLELSNRDSDINKVNERYEILENLISDKKEQIQRLERQVQIGGDEKNREICELKNFHQRDREEAIATLRSELASSHSQDLEKLREQLINERKEQERSIRQEMERNRSNEFESIQSRLKEEYEAKIAELIRNNETLERKLSENAVSVKLIEDTSRRLETAEMSYSELSTKHQQFVQKNLQMSTDLISLRNKVEELEQKNETLVKEKKVEQEIFNSEKQRLASDLDNAKEEMQRIHEEGLSLKGEVKELEGERNKLAGVISIMKEEWEKQYKNLKEKFQQSEVERIDLLSQVTDFQEENLKLKETTENLDKQKDALSKLLEEHQNGMQTLMKDMASEREVWRQKEADLITNHESMESEFKQKGSELIIVREELEIARSERQTMKQKLIDVGKEKVAADIKVRELETEKKKIEGDLSKISEEKSRLSSQLTDARKQLDRLKEQFKDLKDDDESRILRLTKEKEELKDKLSNISSTHSEELKAKLNKIEIEYEKKEMEICQLETSKRQLQTRIEGLEASTNRLTIKLKAAESDAEQTKRNADIQSRELQNRLRDSQIEIEELHKQVTDLRQKLIEKEHIVETHNRQSANKDDVRLSNATMTITTLNKQIEKYKVSHEVLEEQIASLNKKLSDADGKADKSITQAEKTISMLRNKLDTIQKEHTQEKNQLKVQQEEEIANLTKMLESIEKRQRNISTNDGNISSSKLSDLEQKIKELESLLKKSQGECDRLSETLAQVQMRYLDAINDKDQLTHEKREVDKRFRTLETQYQEVLQKNMDLAIQLSSR
ncbi:unnamed protein product [Rhizophagus irregularis]|nr:unnamed protein product [Rhizophagus irregularis]